MTLESALHQIESATSAPALFRGDPDSNKELFRRLSVLVHPDKNPGDKRAAEAFAKMSGFYTSLNGAAREDVAIGKWKLGRPLVKGDICDLHLVEGKPGQAVLKIAREAADNDLLEREAEALKTLHADKRSDNFKRYLPALLDKFEASGRRANVLSHAEGYYSLTYIRSQFPSGIPLRHVVWMMNRLLSVLGFAHRNGFIHGAVTPDHLLYRPEDHSLILAGWCSATKFPDDHGHIPMMVSRWKAEYPAEVEKKDCYPATDLYMAARAMLYAMASDWGAPKRFKHFFAWCQAESAFARPQDAWELQEQWKRLAEEEFGPPKFVEFKLPA